MDAAGTDQSDDHRHAWLFLWRGAARLDVRLSRAVSAKLNHAFCIALSVAAALTMVGAVYAQEKATIRLGGRVLKTYGVVTEAVTGDVACYLTMKDDRGALFTEMAAFELCDQTPSLKGHRVALAYKMERVLADECAGDPACQKTKLEPLVTRARIIDRASRRK